MEAGDIGLLLQLVTTAGSATPFSASKLLISAIALLIAVAQNRLRLLRVLGFPGIRAQMLGVLLQQEVGQRSRADIVQIQLALVGGAGR